VAGASVCIGGRISGFRFARRNVVPDFGYTIPTIFITAFPTAALRAEIEAKGAAAFLEKPVDATTVERLLNLALGTP
jgi:FixJ family two-component response regulator